MAPPIFWTEQRLERLEELYLADKTHAEMAAEFGTSARACGSALSRFGISSWLSCAARRSRTQKGKRPPKSTRRKMSAAAKERHADPNRRSAAFHQPDRVANARKGWNKRRGVHVPADQREDFLALRRKLNSIAEAAALLGLKPVPAARQKPFRWRALEQRR